MRRGISLKAAWYGLVTLLVLLPLILLGPWLGKHAYTLLLDQALKEESVRNERIKNHLELEVARIVDVLVNKSDPMANILASTINQALLQRLLQAVLAREAAVQQLHVLDARGRPLTMAARRDGRLAALMEKIPPAHAAVVIPLNGRAHIGSMFRLGNQAYLVTSVPIALDAKVLGVLLAVIDTETLWQAIEQKLHRPGVLTYGVDNRGSLLTPLATGDHVPGELLSHLPSVRAVIAHKPWHGEKPYQGLAGKLVYATAALADTLDWGIISEIPHERILQPIIRRLGTATAVAVAIMVALGGLGLMLTRRMLNPLQTLSGQFRQAAQGDYAVALPHAHIREIDALAEDFGRMVSAIGERKRSLEKSNALLAEAQPLAHLGNWEWHVADNELLWSDEVYRIFGLDAQQFTPSYEAFLQCVHPDDRKQVETAVKAALRQCKPYSIEHRIVRPNGTTAIVYERGKVAFDERQQPVRMYGTVQDISEEKRLRDKMEQRQRMESLGVLAGGIAHDFNNLLTAVMGNATLARLKIGEEAPAHRHLERIESASLQAADLCKQMLAYAGQGQYEVTHLNLAGMIRAMDRLLAACMGEQTQFTLDLAPDTPCIRGDIRQLQQLVLNLVTNAAEAIGDAPGSVELTTGIHAGGFEGFDILGGHRPGKGCYAFLRVRDDGCGMDDNTREKIFDPFFSTKFMGRGLGLSAVFGIVRAHHGAIGLESQPQQGTTFTILLPCAETAGEETAPDATWCGQGRLILVEGNRQVREMAGEMLEAMGFEVLRFDGMSQALAAAKGVDESIVAAVIDADAVALAGVPDLAAWRRLYPDIRLILASDQPPSVISDRFPEASAFLHKPYAAAGLTRALRAALEPIPG